MTTNEVSGHPLVSDETRCLGTVSDQGGSSVGGSQIFNCQSQTEDPMPLSKVLRSTFLCERSECLENSFGLRLSNTEGLYFIFETRCPSFTVGAR